MSVTRFIFKTAVVLRCAKATKDDIQKARRREAVLEWNEEHKQCLLARILKLKPKPIPAPDEAWIQRHVNSNFLSGYQLQIAEDFIAYCEMPDATPSIEISREDASRLNLI